MTRFCSALFALLISLGCQADIIALTGASILDVRSGAITNLTRCAQGAGNTASCVGSLFALTTRLRPACLASYSA